MEVDLLGVDLVGVDFVRVDLVGGHRCAQAIFLLDFTVDRWASSTNIVLDFQCNFLEQQVPKSKFGSSLPNFNIN